MTAQISDAFRCGDEEYSIIAISEPISFNPRNYGLKPFYACTACYKGYWCTYNINENGIVLEKLFIHTLDGNYPEIDGVAPSGEEDACFGHRLYNNINLKINYTGKILVGDEFIEEYYIHMGTQKPWAYKVLIEFVFENGKLTEKNDKSHLAAELREMLRNRADKEFTHEETEYYINILRSINFGGQRFLH